ncbi:serine--tRNA ligase [Acidisoma cellulosilytica]|uniref:Serine--tRNA ligase n=1 Tax=Acidisoma cellulosilyticum TaxID=2802395 RepID=A0A963Z7Y6_9PROT|nr:serine--tRNA ligase [Acidisoma cellulosilyticum]MCB8883508.1 serine--tRNA ligase [Acidisoma cellulosilyticum]
MHDIRAIRAEPEAFDAAMARRGLPPIAQELLAYNDRRRDAEQRYQEIQTRRKLVGQKVGSLKQAKSSDDREILDLQAEALSLREMSNSVERDALGASYELNSRLETLPNILDADVPDGRDESANVTLKTWGQAPEFDFTPRQHFELGEALGLMDFAGAAKIAGARFTVLRGKLARLERALGQFMIDLHTNEHGYEEMAVPSLVNDAAVYGTSQLPKFSEDLFRTTDGRWLIPTAEVPLTNMAAAEITPQASLPWRMTALTDCFRSEAGSAGRDTRGMLRQHQFRKVEMVSITHPEQSDAEHERMTRCAETVLERLGLSYRRLLLCTGDTGFGSARTFDLEVWLPGQQAWREISSCSNMRDFQARRMNARFRAADGKTLGFAHTLNGSGLAVGRALIAVMETYQQADGTIRVPEALRPYLGGLETISA